MIDAYNLLHESIFFQSGLSFFLVKCITILSLRRSGECVCVCVYVLRGKEDKK